MQNKPKILYVEDDLTLSFVTRDNLELKGYDIDFCGDGYTALEKINAKSFDMCILDVMLPKMDGFTLAKKIREVNEEIPIIFLTAKSTKEDKIYGLKLGADDYITKPFSIEELSLKIEVFLKRRKISAKKDDHPGLFNVGFFIFDAGNQYLQAHDKQHRLTHKESELLLLLIKNRDNIVKRDDILLHVWGNDRYFSSRSLDVFISRLRKILKSDPKIRIENIHNVGYRFRSEE